MAGLAFRNRYGGGLVENSCNLGVHLDHVVAFDCNPLIASVDLGVDPIGEVLSNNSVNNVAQIRPAEFGDFLGWRKSPFDLLVITWDDALYPHGEVPKVPDGHRLVAR